MSLKIPVYKLFLNLLSFLLHTMGIIHRALSPKVPPINQSFVPLLQIVIIIAYHGINKNRIDNG
jgi:hypothetical protein